MPQLLGLKPNRQLNPDVQAKVDMLMATLSASIEDLRGADLYLAREQDEREEGSEQPAKKPRLNEEGDPIVVDDDNASLHAASAAAVGGSAPDAGPASLAPDSFPDFLLLPKMGGLPKKERYDKQNILRMHLRRQGAFCEGETEAATPTAVAAPPSAHAAG